MKKCILIVGPECSGTKMLTECFCKSDYYGEYTHHQKLNNLNFSNLPDKIVYRQSVPSKTKWLRYDTISNLVRVEGYELKTIGIFRNPYFTARSQVRRGHSNNLEQAYKKINKAVRQIFSRANDLEIVLYEPFVEVEKYRKRLFSEWDINPTPEMIFENKNNND